MDDKQKLELYERLDCLKKEEREISNRSYAEKRAEYLIYAFCGMALIAVVGALLKFVIIS